MQLGIYHLNYLTSRMYGMLKDISSVLWSSFFWKTGPLLNAFQCKYFTQSWNYLTFL